MIFPSQRNTVTEKQQPEFYRAVADYLITVAMNNNNKSNLEKWLKAANGDVDNSELEYLVTPFKDENGKDSNKLPGGLRSTDIINVVREKQLSDYIRLPYDFTVTVQSSDSILERDAKISDEVNNLAQQAFINILNQKYAEYQQAQQQGQEAGQPLETEIPTLDIPDIETFVKDFIENWIDERAIKGHNLVKFIFELNDYSNKRFQAFFYWWACEEFYTITEVVNNQVCYDIISPLDGYPISSGHEFVEDDNAFVRVRKITLTEIKEKYRNEFDNIELEYLDSLAKNQQGQYGAKGPFFIKRSFDEVLKQSASNDPSFLYPITDEGDSLYEYTYFWRTEIKIKVRTYLTPLGEQVEEIIDDSFNEEEDINVTLDIRDEWVAQVWYGRRFGNTNIGLYTVPKPYPIQRYDIATGRLKLPVGGKKGILTGIKQNPIPNRLIQYVLIDRMILLHQERFMAKYQSHIQLVPQSMINSDSAGTTQQKLFYMKADNTLIYDDTQVDFNTAAQAFRIIGNPALTQYLSTLLELRRAYRQEALEAVHSNDVLMAQTADSIGKGVFENKANEARLGSILSITMFNAALERDLNCIMEASKVAYENGTTISVFNKETDKNEIFYIDPLKHNSAQYGIFLKNAKLEESKINAYRSFAFSAAQNGDFELASAAIEGDSIPVLRKAVKEIEDKTREFEREIENQKAATAKYVADTQLQIAREKNETELQKAQIMAAATVEAKAIGEGSSINSDANMNSIPDSIEFGKLVNDSVKTSADINLREKELDNKRLEREQKNATERYKIDKQVEIAKTNRNKYDK